MKMKQVIIILGLAGLLIAFAACPPPAPGNETPTPEPTIEPATPTPLPVATSEPLSLTIREFQGFSTDGARDWEYFTLDGEPYLAVANYNNGSTYNINSHIYKWNGYTFVLEDSIATWGAMDFEYFSIEGKHYLAIANHYHQGESGPYSTTSWIYQWNPDSKKFVWYQNIATAGAYDWEFFTIGFDHFLAVANYHNDTSQNTSSYIYKWNGSNFDSLQAIATNGALDWQYFTIRDDHYLVVANYYNGSSYNIPSYVYKWNGATFDQLQPIPTNGAASWEYFTIGESHFLAVANSYDGSKFTLNSRIYKWDPNTNTFIPFQPIETIDAWDWHYFSVADNHFLAVANAYDGSTWNINSYIYQWNGTEFDIDNPYPIATNCAVDLNSFTIDGNFYLTVANYYNDSSYNILSRLYRILY